MLPNGGIDVAMFQGLQTQLTLDDALDLLEIQEAQQSWQAAHQRNSDRLDAIAERRGH